MKKLQQTQDSHAFTLILFPRFSTKMITVSKNQIQTSRLTESRQHQKRADKSTLLFTKYSIIYYSINPPNDFDL